MNRRSDGAAAAPGQSDPPLDFRVDHHAATFVHSHKDINDEIGIDRSPNRHLTFGVGGHLCSGTRLARAEIRIMLQSLLGATSGFELAGDGVVYPRTIGQLLGKKAVHIRMTPKEGSR
ncbi:MAG: cytochrome P450 [Pseudomonadota bacterium]